jgi:hypothetical protein
VGEKDCVTAKAVPATFHVGSRNGHWQSAGATEYMLHNAVLARSARKGLSKRQKCKSVVMARDVTTAKGKAHAPKYNKCFP